MRYPVKPPGPVCRMREGAMFVLRFVMNGGVAEGSSPLSSELQFANLAVALGALVLVNLAFWRWDLGVCLGVK